MSDTDTTAPLLGGRNEYNESEQRYRNYGSSTSTEISNNQERNNSSGDVLLLDNQRSTLGFFQKIGFGLGHVYNDLCAGVWFSYTLLFLKNVILLKAVEAGALLMIGQIGDALATPIIGLLTDRIGTKRQWHIAATILVFLSFPMIFALCPGCESGAKWWPPIYFGLFILLFQFAWACVQVTHLSMISEMSLTKKDRSDLTSVRYAGSVCSSIIVFVITLFMLSHNESNSSNTIGPNDAFRFRDISLILTLIGTAMTVLFHFSLALSGYERRRVHFSERLNDDTKAQATIYNEGSNRERNSENEIVENSKDENINISNSKTTLSKQKKTSVARINFFKTRDLYQNGFLYVFSRLFMTTSMIYLPLWLDERARNHVNPTDIANILPDSNLTLKPLELNTGFLTPMTPIVFSINDIIEIETSEIQHLATVPLASFLSSFLTSVILKQFNNKIGNRTSYLIGCLIGLSACFWIVFAHSINMTTVILHLIAIIFGCGSSITMISSICLIADMIGEHVYQGGFIYSVVTFADKFITGIFIVLIETFNCKDKQKCPNYYENVLANGCAISALLGILILSTTLCNKRHNQVPNQNNINVVI